MHIDTHTTTHLTPAQAVARTPVCYVPNHVLSAAKQPNATLNLSHPDVERGIIIAWNPDYCFVLYDGDIHSKATAWTNLFKY